MYVFYPSSWSGYNDELAWSAAWLYRATGSNNYKNDAKSFYNDAGFHVSSLFSWDQKQPGTAVLMAEMDGASQFTNDLKDYCNDFRNKANAANVACYNHWGNNRYSANAAFICVKVNFSQNYGLFTKTETIFPYLYRLLRMALIRPPTSMLPPSRPNTTLDPLARGEVDNIMGQYRSIFLQLSYF